jgi:hypothetical protein
VQKRFVRGGVEGEALVELFVWHVHQKQRELKREQKCKLHGVDDDEPLIRGQGLRHNNNHGQAVKPQREGQRKLFVETRFARVLLHADTINKKVSVGVWAIREAECGKGKYLPD